MDFPSMLVTDRVAIVTGSGSGIGRAIALGLAGAGADVVITELPHKLEAAEAVAAEVRATGRRALVCALDVRNLESIQDMVHSTINAFGRIDILVNNAGIQIAKPALEVTEADWDAVLDTNLKGVFFCSQAVGREMVKQQRGKIVNIASINGVIGYYNRAAYCSAKAGVVNLTRVLAIEWAPYNINVNAVAPTYILTPLTERTLSDPATYQDIINRMPLRRLGRPEDVVGAVIYLASPAADMVTGHTLLVDGGWTAW